MTAIALISLLVTAAITAWAVETRARALWTRPAGTAAQDEAALAAADEQLLEELIRAGAVQPGEHRWCPECARTTYQAVLPCGAGACWTCLSVTPAGAQ